MHDARKKKIKVHDTGRTTQGRKKNFPFVVSREPFRIFVTFIKIDTFVILKHLFAFEEYRPENII